MNEELETHEEPRDGNMTEGVVPNVEAPLNEQQRTNRLYAQYVLEELPNCPWDEIPRRAEQANADKVTGLRKNTTAAVKQTFTGEAKDIMDNRT